MWPVFITATRAPQKALNRAFLLIQDFDKTLYPERQWTLLTSQDRPSAPPSATALPLPDITGRNDFASMSSAEINEFTHANTDLWRRDYSGLYWLIIDQKGLETSTCLVCERVYHYAEEEQGELESGPTREFHACRIPYEEAWGMMGTPFWDWADESAGVQEDGSWRWSGFGLENADCEEKTPAEIKREKALKELRDAGLAD
ncbi:hypothetical protein B0H19DRAFT_1266751 [Mycena capillaripes]|nr:hypothetical protein B0H19DRAFT_1266751 [Mycena capillaripes]